MIEKKTYDKFSVILKVTKPDSDCSEELDDLIGEIAEKLVRARCKDVSVEDAWIVLRDRPRQMEKVKQSNKKPKLEKDIELSFILMEGLIASDIGTAIRDSVQYIKNSYRVDEKESILNLKSIVVRRMFN